MTYTDPAELETITGVTAQDLKMDPAAYSLLLSKLIARAKAIIDGYLQKSFEQGTVTEKYDGDGKTNLFLGKTPIQTVQTVLLDDTDITAEILQYRTYIYYPLGFSNGRQNIEVSYTYGENVPDPVKAVSFDMCSKMLRYFKAQQTAQGMESERLGDYQYKISQEELLTEENRTALKRWKDSGGIV